MQVDSKSVSLAAAAFAAAVVALPLFANAGPAPAPQFTAEKCYGIAAASQNDCQTATHSCAGDLGAGAGRDVDPRICIPRLLGFAGAGMCRGLTVILRRGRDSIAFLGGELRRWSGPGIGEERQSHRRGKCGSGERDRFAV